MLPVSWLFLNKQIKQYSFHAVKFNAVWCCFEPDLLLKNSSFFQKIFVFCSHTGLYRHEKWINDDIFELTTPLTRWHLNNRLNLSTLRTSTPFSFCLSRGKVSITLGDSTATQSEASKGSFRGQLSWLLLPQRACVFPSAQIFNIHLITQSLACSRSCVWSSELSLVRCVSYYVAQIICHTQTKAHMSKPRVCDMTTHSGTFGRLHTSRHTYTHTSLTPLLSRLQISVLASVLTYQSTAWVYGLKLFEFSPHFMPNKEWLLLGFRC